MFLLKSVLTIIIVDKKTLLKYIAYSSSSSEFVCVAVIACVELLSRLRDNWSMEPAPVLLLWAFLYTFLTGFNALHTIPTVPKQINENWFIHNLQGKDKEFKS